MPADRFVVDHRPHRIAGHVPDLCHFVGGAESIEKMQHGHARAKSDGLGDQRQIHHLLGSIRREHGEARCACGHDIAVITENRQGLAGQGSRRDVKDRRSEFPGNLVHVRQHEQQTLGCGKRRRQSAALKRTVDSTGSAGLGLHLDHSRDRAPEIGSGLGRPLVRPFAHRRRRSDRIDRYDFVRQVRDARGGFIAVDRQIVLFLRHTAVSGIVFPELR